MSVMMLLREAPNGHTDNLIEAGFMLAFARLTRTEMLAVSVNPDEGCYLILLRFGSQQDNKDEFLHLLRADEITAKLHNQICAPLESEIRRAQPLEEALSVEVLSRIILVAAMNSWDDLAVNGY